MNSSFKLSSSSEVSPFDPGAISFQQIVDSAAKLDSEASPGSRRKSKYKKTSEAKKAKEEDNKDVFRVYCEPRVRVRFPGFVMRLRLFSNDFYFFCLFFSSWFRGAWIPPLDG